MTKAAELAKMGEVLTNSQIGGRRNMVINGAMNVAQRATSASGLGGSQSYPTVDRFNHAILNTTGILTSEQVADGPSGFANCLKLSCTTADTSISANEAGLIEQKFEGQNLQQLKKGTSDAEKVTVSFYVKGNANATYTVELEDNDNARFASQEFSVTTSWTRVVKTFVADTTGTLDDDNNVSLSLKFWLHGGSTYTGGTHVSNTWGTTTNARLSDNQTSFFDSTDRTFFITGIQLEVGSQATPFEHRSYGEELALCQRYYQIIPKYTFFTGAVEVGTASLRAGVPLARTLRASPTIGNITLVIYDDDDTPFSNAAHAIFSNSESPEVDGTTGYLSVIFNGNLSGRTDNHNVTALYGTNGTLDSEL